MKYLFDIFDSNGLFSLAVFLGLLAALFWWIRNLKVQNSELEQRNNQLVQDKVALLDQAQEKKHFVSLLAHELRSPLALTRFNTENLLSRKELSADDKQDLEEIGDASADMEEIILKIVEVENLEEPISNAIEMQLDEVIATSIAHYEGLAREKGVDIEWDVVSGSAYRMSGNPYLLLQVVNNLLSNAIKFSPKGQKVWVSLKRLGDAFEIRVKDQGPGIAEAEQSLIFKKYYWKNDRQAPGPESMGLGLYLVKWFVERLRGQLKLQSAQGEGGEFIVTIPFK